MNYVVSSYENYDEENRLTTNNSRKIEFITTLKALDNILPQNGKILDCAAGTGIYAFHYAEHSYDVTALDITPKHVEYMNKKLKQTNYNIKTAVNNATSLSDFKDESFDIVLCMGPIYHLINIDLRKKCISECKRVLKKDGILVVSYINKFYAFPYVATSDKRFLNMDLANTLIKTGTIRHDDPNCFWTDSYYSTPEEMESLLSYFNFQIIDHLATDGLSPFLKDKVDNMNGEEYKTWCDYHYMVCRQKSILGASNHGLIIGKK